MLTIMGERRGRGGENTATLNFLIETQTAAWNALVYGLGIKDEAKLFKPDMAELTSRGWQSQINPSASRRHSPA